MPFANENEMKMKIIHQNPFFAKKNYSERYLFFYVTGFDFSKNCFGFCFYIRFKFMLKTSEMITN